MTIDRSIDIVARTIYGEARGEYNLVTGGLPSLIAIANVIYNRYNNTGEKLIENVCLKPWQFSCWNTKNPNRTVIQKVNATDSIYRICLNVASNVISEKWPDITNGSTHYYSLFLKDPPYWAVGKNPTIKIGNHLFFGI